MIPIMVLKPSRIPSISRDIKDVEKQPFSGNSAGNDSAMTIAGSNPRTNSITVDGIPLNDDFGLNSGGYPTQRNPFPLDALDQVTVQVAPTNAKSSGFTGGNVDAVFKSGSNEVEGSVFFEKMTDSWAGTPTLDGEEVPLEFDEENYGFSVGAPILQNKLFFLAPMRNMNLLRVLNGPCRFRYWCKRNKHNRL